MFARDVLTPFHLIIILVIVLVIFGPGKLTEIGGALGKGIREFKKSTAEQPETLKATESPAPSVSTAANSNLKACPVCHTENPVANKFCAHCGAVLAST